MGHLEKNATLHGFEAVASVRQGSGVDDRIRVLQEGRAHLLGDVGIKNPATGGTAFTGGLSQSQEIRMGRENHPKIIKEFGGEYGTPDLKRYVNGIGQLLAKTAERRDLKFTFTVLDSDIINAFATPGGYVYITRGLMALADNEAQLAGVLAHEIGHITALHHARRYGQSILANIGLAAVGILQKMQGHGLLPQEVLLPARRA